MTLLPLFFEKRKESTECNPFRVTHSFFSILMKGSLRTVYYYIEKKEGNLPKPSLFSHSPFLSKNFYLLSFLFFNLMIRKIQY